MIIGKSLKLLAIVGGGILAFGGGAAGMHFAYPTVEKNFFPERIQREQKLKESFDESEKEVIKLGHELSSMGKLNSKQKRKISDLTTQSSELNKSLLSKTAELDQKTKTLEEKKTKISEQETLNQKQTQEITTLTSQVTDKQNEISRINEEKIQVEGKLTKIKNKLDLTKQDILKPQKSNMNLLNIKLKKIEFKGFDGTYATFNITNRGTTTTFKVQKGNLTNHEEIAKYIQTQGISFGLYEPDFQAWDKIIKATRYDVDYSHKTTDSSLQRHFTKNDNQEKRDIKITDYFNDDFVGDAFKVFIAIKQLDFFPLRYDLTGKSDYIFHFSDAGKITQSFSTTNTLTWGDWKETDENKKTFIWTNRFETIDDFIKYWISKTIDFIRTGTVDLFDFLNPINRSENYKK